VVSQQSNRVRVLCVDDNHDVSAGIGYCVAAEADMESAGSLDRADDVVSVVAQRGADVVLMDMNMPGKDPLEAVRELAAAHPPWCGMRPASGAPRPVRVILFSGRDDQELVDRAEDAGACGFLSKHASIPMMLEAIRVVSRAGKSFGVWR